MSRLANANVRSKVIRALVRAGLEQREGGKHTIMQEPDHPDRFATIPRHSRIKPMLLKKILKQCGITEDRFLELYC